MKSSARLLRVLQFILSKQETDYKEIEESLSLSQRVVRYEVDNINDFLSLLHYPLIEKESKGKLMLRVGDNQSMIDKILEIAKPSSEERREFIIFKLLIEGHIVLQHEMEEFDVSRNTLRRDFLEIKAGLGAAHIQIKDYRIYDTEEGVIRKYLLNNYMKDYLILFEKEIDYQIISLVQMYILKDFRKIETANLSLFTEFFVDVKMQNNQDHLTSCIFIAYQRIKRMNLITCKNLSFLINTKEYEDIKCNIHLLEEALCVSFPIHECAELTDYVLGFMRNTYDAYMDAYLYDNLMQSYTFVCNFIQQVSDDIKFDLTKDQILLEGLDYHFKSLIYRMKNGFVIEDVLYYEAVSQYPDLYHIVEHQLQDFEKMLNMKLSKEEISLCVIHFLGSIRRNEDQCIQKKRIILVCGSGYGTSVIIRNLMESTYYIEVIDTISYYQLKMIDLHKADILVTTIDLSFELREQLPIPVVMVSPFLSFQDDKNLMDYGIQRKTRMNHPSVQMMMSMIDKYAVIKDKQQLEVGIKALFGEQGALVKQSLFDHITRVNIQVVNSLPTWAASLQMCGDALLSQGAIKKEYMKEIFNTIENYGAYFVLRNEVALPHGQSSNNIIQGAMQILYIREGVLYPENRKVRLIFLIASNDKRTLLNTVMSINSITHRLNLYEEIEKNMENQTLLEYFMAS